jgi:hypothetical protein
MITKFLALYFIFFANASNPDLRQYAKNNKVSLQTEYRGLSSAAKGVKTKKNNFYLRSEVQTWPIFLILKFQDKL